MSEIIKSGKIKDNSRKSGAAAAALDRRRMEASVRQEEYSKLTPQQKMARLNAGGFRATKQRATLTAEISQLKEASK